MTRTNNDELVEIALKITAKDAEASRLRQRASLAAMDRRVRQILEKEAWSLDDDICQLCTELRIACLPVSA